MKLRNRKTGEIIEFDAILPVKDVLGDSVAHLEYDSLSKFNEEWEDYEELKEYWYIYADGDIYKDVQDDVRKDNGCKEIGNYFSSREEAEKAMEKLKAWKRLKDNCFKIKGWKFTPDIKQIQGNYVKIEAEIPQILINEKDIDLLFGGEE